MTLTEAINAHPTCPAASSETSRAIAVLTKAQTEALLICLAAGGLRYRSDNDHRWHPLRGKRAVHALTIRDLERNAMMIVSAARRQKPCDMIIKTATLTGFGKQCALALAEQAKIKGVGSVAKIMED